MKIRHKFFACMILLCFALIMLGSLAILHHAIIPYAFIAVCICALTTFGMYMFIIKHIENLNEDLLDIHSGNTKSQKIVVNSQDEIAEIATRINVLLEAVKIARQQLFLLSESKPLEENNQPPKSGLLNDEAERSGLVKLPDRVFFNEALNKALSYAKRHNKFLAVLVIDVELLKDSANAKLSMTTEIINEIARLFSSVLRGEDVLAKLDGNEFIVLLHDIGKPKFASAVSEKLLHALSSGISINAREVMVRTSIGVCICPIDTSTLEEAIEKTYSALYRAKVIPGSHYQFHTPQLDIEAREYVHMRADLQKAIENHELILHYQPKINLKKGSIVGVEVLIRWSHPTLGVLTPGRFLDVAEDSGYIIQIGEWALREACRVNVHWQNEGYEHISIAMNLSTKQFFDANLARSLTTILNETKMNPHFLELEVNEETIMKDLDKSSKIMSEIIALGVQITIDHFGKGYTSISHLKHLPVSTIKIDRGFIKGIPMNPNDSAITSAIIALAHYLGISALAEGVENAEQLQFLTQQNCDLVQGYFLSYPLPVDTVVQHFKKMNDRAMS